MCKGKGIGKGKGKGMCLCLRMYMHSSRFDSSCLVSSCVTLVACFVFLCCVVSCVWRCLLCVGCLSVVSWLWASVSSLVYLCLLAVSVACIVLVSRLLFRVRSGGQSRAAGAWLRCACVCVCVCLCVFYCCMWLCVLGRGGRGVCIERVSVCTFKTFPCVPAPSPYVLYMWAWCRYTRRRLECTQVGFSACHGTPPHHTPHTTYRIHTTTATATTTQKQPTNLRLNVPQHGKTLQVQTQ